MTTMQDLLAKHGVKRAKPRKYRNVPTIVDGLRFDSKAEARRWCDLQLLQKAGEISDLKRQVTYACEVNGALITRYLADFTYTQGGRTVVEDVKGGPETALFRIKAKLMAACHRVDVQIIRKRAA